MIIGFTGKAGAGKTTAAQILRDKFGYQILSFATPIKAMLNVLVAEEPGAKEWNHPNLCGKSYRYAAQTLGTEWGCKLIGEDIWVHAMAAKLAAADLAHERNPGGVNFAIDDVRFQNEVDMINHFGIPCAVFEITNRATTITTFEGLRHTSEGGNLTGLYGKLDNGGNKVDLVRLLSDALNEIATPYEGNPDQE